MYDKTEVAQHYLTVWEAYSALLKEVQGHALRHDYDVWSQVYSDFLKSRIIIGDIPSVLVERAKEALQRCKLEPFDETFFHFQYFSSEFKPGEKLDNLKKNTSQYHLSAEVLWAITDIYDHIRDEVAVSLGSPWRVLGTRAWQLTDTSIDGTGANNWHSDALPLNIFKIMCYLTPMDSQHGSLRVRMINGEEVLLERENPTWVLFNPTELVHRGVPPSSPDAKRFTVESSITPSMAFDTMAFFAGHNARHPFYPWQRASYAGY